jgi:hypothetical protein
MRRIILPALLATLLLAPAAWADDSKIIRDCALDGVLDGHYTTAELRSARAHLPTDVDEYSDCRDVLSRAIAATVQSSGPSSGGGSGSGPGGTGSGGGASPTPPPDPAQEQEALQRAGQEGGAPVKVDGRDIAPGAPRLAAAHNPLPGSMLAVLVLLGAATLAAIAPFIRRHVRPRPPA